jgi:hypothetical protein
VALTEGEIGNRWRERVFRGFLRKELYDEWDV